MSAILLPVGPSLTSARTSGISAAASISRKGLPLLPPALNRREFIIPLWLAFGLQVAVVLLGYLKTHDTLLDLIDKGVVEAVAPADQKVEQEVYLVDTNPAPPPVANSDFVKPEEVVPTPVRPVVKTTPSVPVQVKPVEKVINFAPASFVVGDTNFPHPSYPYEAKLRHFQGTVVISLNVVGGQIIVAEVASSSGYGVLDSAAIDCVRQRWHFPSQVTRNLSLPISFQLKS